MVWKSRKKRSEDPSKGQQTREKIVAQALLIAAQEGLGAISIGRLAKELRMSKSGLFLHCGSKEQLESAVIERARLQVLNYLIQNVNAAKVLGIERVWFLCDSWLSFVEHSPWLGGYFFTGAFFQTAKQHGPTPRLIRRAVRDWIDALEDAVKQARAREEFKTDVTPQKVAFELNSLLLGAQWSHLMTGKDYTGARSAILSKFRSMAREEIPGRAFDSVNTWKAYLRNRHESGDSQSGLGLSR